MSQGDGYAEALRGAWPAVPESADFVMYWWHHAAETVRAGQATALRAHHDQQRHDDLQPGRAGDGYVEVLRGAWPSVPESADFVMFWWHHAAHLVRHANAKRFGLITTNSLRQTFNRQVIERHVRATPALRLRVAIPDHPWVDCSGDAAVRIAMTVGTIEDIAGELRTVTEEREVEHGELTRDWTCDWARSTLTFEVGADVSAAVPLLANCQTLLDRGVQSRMAQVSGGCAMRLQFALRLATPSKVLPKRYREYRNGRDLTSGRDERSVIDTVRADTEQSSTARYPARVSAAARPRQAGASPEPRSRVQFAKAGGCMRATRGELQSSVRRLFQQLHRHQRGC